MIHIYYKQRFIIKLYRARCYVVMIYKHYRVIYFNYYLALQEITHYTYRIHVICSMKSFELFTIVFQEINKTNPSSCTPKKVFLKFFWMF
jgi:hypothetical protein